MRISRRILGTVVLLLASVVLVGCVAGIVGAWVLRGAVSARIETTAAQLDRALERASAATTTLQGAMETVRGGVQNSKADPLGLEPGGYKNREVTEFLGTVTQRLGTFSELSPMVSALLRNLRKFPIRPTDEVTAAMLDRAAARSAALSAAVTKLRATFDRQDILATEAELIDGATEIDRAVATCEEAVREWQSDLDSARAGLPSLTMRLRRGLTLAAVAATLLGAWLGASQISLIAHARRWGREAALESHGPR